MYQSFFRIICLHRQSMLASVYNGQQFFRFPHLAEKILLIIRQWFFPLFGKWLCQMTGRYLLWDYLHVFAVPGKPLLESVLLTAVLILASVVLWVKVLKLHQVNQLWLIYVSLKLNLLLRVELVLFNLILSCSCILGSWYSTWCWFKLN